MDSQSGLSGDSGDWLLARLAERPDLTIRALTAELAVARGVHVAHDTVLAVRAARRADSQKKTLIASEQMRPKVARFRVRWRAHQHRLDPGRLVFIDEPKVRAKPRDLDQDQHDRTRGWSPRGTRLAAPVPHGHLKTLTFLAGLRHDSIVAPFVLDGPINGNAFTAWVRQCLVPTLAPGDVVVADNLGSHKGLPARQLIRGAGAHLLFLPPYSPDLNPIEMVSPNSRPSKAEERSIEASWRRIGTLLDAFTPDECQNYLRHAGYAAR